MNVFSTIDAATLIVLCACAVWLIFFAIVGLNGLAMKPLASEVLPQMTSFPRLSVIIAACNEADTIGQALQSLLGTTYPNLEIIIVNDRSTDETGTIIDRLAAQDKRIKTLHVTTLPTDWLGKVHALHVASEAATGDFLLFTDADIHFVPETLTHAIAFAEQHQLDHLAMAPETRKPSSVSAVQQWLISLVIAGFSALFLFAMRIRKLRKPDSKAFVGIGAFNLVRKSAFRKTGGFAWLKMEVLDDVGLGMMMKRSGARCDCVNGVGLIHLEWYPTLSAIRQGFEKNFFAGFGHYRWLRIMWRVTQLAAMVFLPWAVALWVWWSSAQVLLVFLLVCVHIALPVGIATWKRKGLPVEVSVFAALPLAFAFVIAFMLRSAWHVSRKGGITWRGTFYSLETLRREQRVRM